MGSEVPPNNILMGDLYAAHNYANRRLKKAMCSKKGALKTFIPNKLQVPDPVSYQTKTAFESVRVSEGVATYNNGVVIEPGKGACPEDYVKTGLNECLWSSNYMYTEFEHDHAGDEFKDYPDYRVIEDGKCAIINQTACEALSHSAYNSLNKESPNCTIEPPDQNVKYNPYLEWRGSAGLCDVTPAKSCQTDSDCPEFNWCYGVQPAWGDDLNGLDWAESVVGLAGPNGAGRCRASPAGQICPFGHPCGKDGRCACRQHSDCAGSSLCDQGKCTGKDQNDEPAGSCVIANDGVRDMLTKPQCKCPEANPTSTDGSDPETDCRNGQDIDNSFKDNGTVSLSNKQIAPPMEYDTFSGGAAITPEYCHYFGHKFTSGKKPSDGVFVTGADKSVWTPCNQDTDCKGERGDSKPGYTCHLFDQKADYKLLGFSETIVDEWADYTGIPENDVKNYTNVAGVDEYYQNHNSDSQKYKGVCVGPDSTCFTPYGETAIGTLTGNTMMLAYTNWSRFKMCSTVGLKNKIGSKFGLTDDNGQPMNPWTADPKQQQYPPGQQQGGGDSDSGGGAAAVVLLDQLLKQILNSAPSVDVLLLPPEEDAILAFPSAVGTAHVYIGRRAKSPTLTLQFETDDILKIFPRNCVREGNGVRFTATAAEATGDRDLKRMYYFVQNSEVLAKTFFNMMRSKSK